VPINFISNSNHQHFSADGTPSWAGIANCGSWAVNSGFCVPKPEFYGIFVMIVFCAFR
jgi:hypothetical protein